MQNNLDFTVNFENRCPDFFKPLAGALLIKTMKKVQTLALSPKLKLQQRYSLILVSSQMLVCIMNI